MADSQSIAHPIPQKPFELTPDPSDPPTPSGENTNPEIVESKVNGGMTPSRTRSFLNLTSSTLFGIYSPTGSDFSTRDESTTPWGTGARTPHTPGARNSTDSARPPVFPTGERKTVNTINFRRKRDFRNFYLPLALRGILLFLLGLAYALLIARLHDNPAVTPVKVSHINRQSRSYFIGWGASGVILGGLLPWFDAMWSKSPSAPALNSKNSASRPSTNSASARRNRDTESDSDLGAAWNPAVRSIGAFIGIAFAIRRLPWDSTSQASLTLALANPALWFLIDRTLTGLILSFFVGIFGALVSSAISPQMVPLPFFTTSVPQESIGVWTWVASVLFCSCVCFGNVGRRLTLSQNLHGGNNEFYWSTGPST